MKNNAQLKEPIENSTNNHLNGIKPVVNAEVTGENSRIVGKPFKPGQSGNPKGRPKGARSKLSEKFLVDLRDCWNEKGRQVLDTVAEKDPAKLLTAMVAVLPKDFQVSVRDETNERWVINAKPLSVDEWQAEHGLDRTDTVVIEPEDS